MPQPTPFTIQAGRPWSQGVRVHDATTIWPTVGSVEARMQIRDGRGGLYDMTPHLLVAVDDPDITVRWDLSGHQTRLMRTGAYDLWLSDPGAVDQRAEPILYGTITVNPAVTSAT